MLLNESIKNIINRAKGVEQKITLENFLFGTSWYLSINGQNSATRIVFEPSNELIISSPSGVIEGNYKILQNHAGIKIDLEEEKHLLNTTFLHPHLCILHKDFSDEYWFLGNASHIAELNENSIVSKINALLAVRDTYYVSAQGGENGPFTYEELDKLYRAKKIHPNAFYRTPKNKSYKQRKRLRDLFKK